MGRTPPLTSHELVEALKALPSWRAIDGVLTRTLTLSTFPAAIEWVGRVAAIAEDLNHHPDIDIRWRTVTLRLCTHDSGDQITALDVELAARMDAITPGVS